MSSRVYRAVTLQSKDVVDLLLRGETYRCDVEKSRTQDFVKADYDNCSGLAPVYIYMDSLFADITLGRNAFPRIVRMVGCEASYSVSYNQYMVELLLDHVPPIGETYNANKYVRVIPEIRPENVSAIYHVDTQAKNNTFVIDVVYKTEHALFSESQLWDLQTMGNMDENITYDIEKLRRDLSIEEFYRRFRKIKLYHVAIGKHDLVRKFYPRVPESANPQEDTITPRICLSESLEGCLSAIGHPFYYPGTHELITVWEHDVNLDDGITPEFLYDNGLVMDALRTREWWLLRPVTLTGRYMHLTNFETTPYRIPDESKREELIKYIRCNALNFDDSDMELLQKSNMHEILYKVLANWYRYKIDEEDAADYIGLSNCKTYCNCKFKEVVLTMTTNTDYIEFNGQKYLVSDVVKSVPSSVRNSFESDYECAKSVVAMYAVSNPGGVL